MMEDEIQNGVTDRTVELLRHHQFTFSVLTLSYEPGINIDVVMTLRFFCQSITILISLIS